MENVVRFPKTDNEAAIESERAAEVARLLEDILRVVDQLRKTRFWIIRATQSERSKEKKEQATARTDEMLKIIAGLLLFEREQEKIRTLGPISPSKALSTHLAAAEANGGVVPPARPAPTIEEAWKMIHRADVLTGIEKETERDEDGDAKILRFPERNRAA